jgi:hypothetical protein
MHTPQRTLPSYNPQRLQEFLGHENVIRSVIRSSLENHIGDLRLKIRNLVSERDKIHRHIRITPIN